MSGAEVDALVRTVLEPSQEATFDTEQDVDFAFSWLDRARLRGSAFTQRGETALGTEDDPLPNPVIC